MKAKNILIRHGEIALRKIESLPTGLKVERTKVFMRGSHGHNHSIDNGKVYLKKDGDFVFGYLEAKNTKLFHEEHSPKGAPIEDGVYEFRKQQEILAEGFRPIID